jgi:4-amino-4-deoxy-L-arabinose transferase-like glycosyltransferase
MSIAPIRYEFHQPPLYYLLQMPLYSLFGGALLPLRLASLLLGGLTLVVVYWSVEALVPRRPWLAWGTAAFVAFLPMHLALNAALNNDALADLLLALALLLLIRYLKMEAGRERTRLLVLLGITTGLGLLTKSSLYILLPFVLLAVAARRLWLDKPPWRPTPRTLVGLAGAGAAFLLPAVGLALPWWLRNVAVYGGLDVLGLGRHEQVVVGQLRTAEFVAQFGAGRLVRDFVVTTFQSFWGQFGWMGVLLDQRLYQVLAVLSALALAGLVVWAVRLAGSRAAAVQDAAAVKNTAAVKKTAKAVPTNRGVPPVRGDGFRRLSRWQWAAVGMLALWGLLTVASYLWYNVTFLQHQGRYLFRALLPIGLAVALGWRHALRRDSALSLAGLFLLAGLLLRLAGWIGNWALLMVAVAAALLALRRVLPRRLDPLVQAAPYLVLVILAIVSLFFFVVPQLAI